MTAALLFLVVALFRFGDGDWPTMWDALSVDLRVGAILYAVAWVVTLWYLGLYAFRVRWTVGSELEDILVASFMLAFATMTFLYLVGLDVSRLFLLILLVVQPAATMASRIALRAMFNWLRTRGYNRCFMLVIGTGADAQAFADAVERHRELGIEVIGHLRAPGDREPLVRRPILGTADELVNLFHQRVVDEVAVCVGASDTAWAAPLIRLAADEGKHVRIPTAAEPSRSFDLQTEDLDGLVIRSYVHGPSRMLGLALKRALDVLAAAAGLILLGPLILAVSIAILVSDGRPVFFHQTRVGLQGRLFTLHKFRTMQPDAEDRLPELIARSDTKGAAFTMRDDPRVTRLGSFLRRSSIDELPQLWNVIRGQMSLIGPRPAPPREVAEYDIWHRRRLSMRPGITGLAQIRTRVDAHFDERAELDLAYIDNWSLARDLGIARRTVRAVFGRTGW